MLNKKAKTILDLGCGRGEQMRARNRRARLLATGADGYLPALKQARHNKTHTLGLILCDVGFLPIKRKSVDIVLCSQVIEHLSKIDGVALLADIEKIASIQVVVGTPVGFVGRPLSAHGSEQENPLEKYESVWISSSLIRASW